MLMVRIPAPLRLERGKGLYNIPDADVRHVGASFRASAADLSKYGERLTFNQTK
jgi:hypothetical protein